MHPNRAVIICIFKVALKALDTFASTLASQNSTWSGTEIYISILLYAVGIVIELLLEIQRKRFKDDPKNQGKSYAGGLWTCSIRQLFWLHNLEKRILRWREVAGLGFVGCMRFCQRLLQHSHSSHAQVLQQEIWRAMAASQEEGAICILSRDILTAVSKLTRSEKRQLYTNAVVPREVPVQVYASD